jgi:hypothetical protein
MWLALFVGRYKGQLDVYDFEHVWPMEEDIF